MNDPELGGFVEASNDELTKKKVEVSNKKSQNGKKTGITCPGCGNEMSVVKANCYECLHCFEKVGGCG